MPAVCTAASAAGVAESGRPPSTLRFLAAVATAAAAVRTARGSGLRNSPSVVGPTAVLPPADKGPADAGGAVLRRANCAVEDGTLLASRLCCRSAGAAVAGVGRNWASSIATCCELHQQEVEPLW